MSGERITRGRPTYGVDVGVMLLNADFPRPVGDIANARTFDFPVHYEVTKGAPVPHVVERAASGLLDHFVRSGRRLIDRGARVLATSCGFLAIFQRELAEELKVPVATSSLLQVPMVLRMLSPDRKLCVLTINASTLSPQHLEGAGIDAEDVDRLVVAGMENSEHFYQVVVGQQGPLDVDRAEAEVVGACQAAVHADASIGAFVLECTNLPPYSGAIRRATGLPVWDATTMMRWLQGGAEGISML